MTDLPEVTPTTKGTSSSLHTKENRVNNADASRDHKRRKTSHSSRADRKRESSRKRDETTPYKSGSSDLTSEDRSHIYSPLEETENSTNNFKWPAWVDPDGKISRENPYAKYFENEPIPGPKAPELIVKSEMILKSQTIEKPIEAQLPEIEFKDVSLELTPLDQYIELDTRHLRNTKALISGDGWRRIDDVRIPSVHIKFLPMPQEPLQDPRISSNFYS